MLKYAFVMCAVLAVALAAEMISELEPKPDKFKHIEGCYISDLDSVIPFGQSAPCTKHCMEYRCGHNTVTMVTCPSVAAEPPLRIVEDVDKPYPHCCPRIVGPN